MPSSTPPPPHPTPPPPRHRWQPTPGALPRGRDGSWDTCEVGSCGSSTPPGPGSSQSIHPQPGLSLPCPPPASPSLCAKLISSPHSCCLSTLGNWPSFLHPASPCRPLSPPAIAALQGPSSGALEGSSPPMNGSGKGEAVVRLWIRRDPPGLLNLCGILEDLVSLGREAQGITDN
ncbi:unnamed protein product [Rangifer tarandus platyrhynchus]|uniref:Uncharacterized protein n=1 Tax=Rangifer tarandus platyrhynchus TaxID=3082113 RepID=A0ABN8ZML8_RANTA|nr:unnamed protein product [Rangifer tarandus platyrhynchus]